MCRVMAVSPPRCERTPADLPAADSGLIWSRWHISKKQLRLSLGSYGRPRITEELKELGLDVGYRRVSWLMRQNGMAFLDCQI